MSAVSQEIPQPLTTKISLKITHLKFTLNFPGAIGIIDVKESMEETTIKITIPSKDLVRRHDNDFIGDIRYDATLQCM